jgi:formylglycine-generating enzyme required for sulfatase activity
MGAYEVTFAEYDAFAQATGRPPPADQGSGAWDPARDECDLGRRPDLRRLAQLEVAPAIPAAVGGRMGVRGAGRDNDGLSLGERVQLEPGQRQSCQ